MTHRDLKATNILIASNGQAKLVDFGLATIDDERKMAAAHGQRTVDYSALERTCGSPKGDKRSDIFFLGCVFYQMLTGQLPLPEVETDDPLKKMLKRGINSIKPLSEQRHAPDPELTEIIEKMMKVDLRLRYNSMSEVVDDLDALPRTAGGQGARPATPPAEAKARTPRSASPTSRRAGDSWPTSPTSEGRPSRPSEVARRRLPRRGPDEAVDDEDEEFVIGSMPEPEPEPVSPFEVKAIVPKRLLCVEVQEEVQSAFRKTLTKMGYRVLLVADPERAAERYRESLPDAVLFDADGLGADALDVVPRHARQGPRGRPRPRRRRPPRPQAALPRQDAADRRPPRRPAQAGQDEGDPERPHPARAGRLRLGARGRTQIELADRIAVPLAADQPGRFRSGAFRPIAFIRVCRSSQASRFQAGLRSRADG